MISIVTQFMQQLLLPPIICSWSESEFQLNSESRFYTFQLVITTNPIHLYQNHHKMNNTNQLNSPKTLLISLLLMASMTACSTAKTAADAPGSTDTNGVVSTTENGKPTQDDAQSETRKKQLESDIRAREERNKIAGNSEKRSDADLASEVRSKLEANIPAGKLTVSAKDANLIVSGVVKTQDQLNKIKSLAMEIKGVKSVTVKADVIP